MEYISSLNPLENVIALTQRLKMRDDCMTNYRAAEIFLKKGAKAGLTLHEIASLIYRDDPEEKSKFEEIMEKSRTIYSTMKPLLKGLPKSLYKTKELGLMATASPEQKKKTFEKIEEEKLNLTLEEELHLQKTRSYSQDHDINNLSISSFLAPLLSTNTSNVQNSKTVEQMEVQFNSEMSLPAIPLKKSISLIELNSKETNKTLHKKKKISRKNKDTAFHSDSLFFYYVENFLDQLVTIYSKEKEKSKNRSRFYSTQYE